MTLVTLARPIVWPGIVLDQLSAGSLTTLNTLDAAGEYQALVLMALEDMVVSHIGFRCTSASGSPTADARIETVDTSTGAPSGTLWATDTNGATGTISANSNVLTALTAAATIPRGSVFAVKFVFSTGTSFLLGQVSQAKQIGTSSFPYNVTNTSGSAAKSALAGTSLFALGSSSTTFYKVPGTLPLSAFAAGNFNNTNGARRGLRFTAQFNARLIGLRNYPDAQVGDCNAIVFSDAGSELSSSSTALDGDIGIGNVGMRTIYFDNPVSVTAGTTYRVVLEPSSATNIALNNATLPSSDYRSASPFGTFGHWTTYASAAWDDTNTTLVPMMDLLFDQIDDGAGSSGGARQKVYGG